MPVISKIRFTNVIYEDGNKRYQDETFHFDGKNGTIVLENGGGKTVWVQTALQAILPHTEVAGRKAYGTFLLSEGCAHIGIEWIIQEKPRRYLVTAVSLYEQSQRLQSYRYVYEYGTDDTNSLENIPYVVDVGSGGKRPTDRAEIQEYYSRMSKNHMNAKMFSTIEQYHDYLSQYHIIATEWKKIIEINGAEGDVAKFFEHCKSTSALVERLLIPTVEDAISGGGTKNFVDAFEKQREHIKRFKQLKHQIEECTHILQQVQGFTQNFEKWDKEQTIFNLLKGKAKGIFALIESEYKKSTLEHRDILEEGVNVTSKLDHLTYKENSYKLMELEKEVEEKNKTYKEALEHYEKIETQINKTNHRIASLSYAQISQALEDCDKEEKGIKEAINRLSQDDTTAEIEESLEENSQYLCGYYKNALEEITKDIEQFQNEELRNNDELDKDKKEKRNLDKQKEQLEKSKIENEVGINYTKEEMQRLEADILDMPQHETVQSKRVQLQKRAEEIETETRQSYDRANLLEDEQIILTDNKATLIKELDQVKDNLRKDENDLDNLENSHERLLQKVHIANDKWSYIDSIYDNYVLITSSIETQIKKTRIALSQAMQHERVSLRWLDDYENGDYFIADPRLFHRIGEWKKEFTLLLTGSEYIQDAKISNFPYWAITLITTDKEVDKLKSYIEENREYISHPVWIMTNHEAVKYLNNDYPNENEFIFPKLWESHIHQPTFKEWKEKLGQEAKIAQTSRKEIQYEYNNWKVLKQEVMDFYKEYPLELYQNLRDNIFSYKEQKGLKEKTLSSIYNREKQIAIEEKDLGKRQVELGREYSHIEGKMEKITQYLRKGNDIEIYKKELNEIINPKLRVTLRTIGTLSRNIKDLEEQLGELKDLLREKIRAKDEIQNQAIYKEVKGYSPQYSTYSKEVLEGQRESLKQELQKQQKGRRELDQQLDKVKKERIEKQTALENQLMRQQDLDKTIRFVEEHIQEIKTLIQKGITLEKTLKEASRNKETAKTQYDEPNGQYKSKKIEFFNTYKEIYNFEVTLSTAKSELAKEKQELNSKAKYIKEQIKRISLELGTTKSAKEKLELKNERFQYLKDTITIVELKEDEKLDTIYQKEKNIDSIIKKLEQTEETVRKKRDQLKKEEQYFIQFCQSSITDIRLKEMTLRGIEKLTEYEQVAQWEKNLHNRIMRTKKVAEDDIKTHDEELQLFIEFIHSYVQQVADGLREIHRKTRVKIDDKWRDVYTIQVPEWEKLQGKEAIQTYILWIIEQLESRKYPEETHRRQIEKWLSVRQLLGIVTGSRQVTVRCRKLTNQNTLASVASSWESSNKWSGGERWSKNMILFLGILNYLAEKTGHVIDGQKRNRTVILDNPFGQASSDHVLSPVFFVAEQLGFQIITLTALAEGSFIRKYFPVVYSCRLRTATDGTQIMAKELQIQRALFRDDELPSVARLETQEQLSLLGG